MIDVLARVSVLLKRRKEEGDAEKSYVASLYARGLNKILEKVGEECTETIIAAKDANITGETKELVHEVADLWFHTMVLLAHRGLGPQQVLDELARRAGVSGHEEKRQRGVNEAP